MATTVENETIPVKSGRLWPMSVEAYHLLGEAGLISKNTELLYGIVYTKMSKSPLHSVLVGHLLELIRAAVAGKFLVRSEQPITCADSEPEPDIAVVTGKNTDYLQQHPCGAELVVEVCVTSRDYDEFKLRAYASAGVKEVWLVLAEKKQVEIYRSPRENEYREHFVVGAGGKIDCLLLPDCSFSLDQIFIQ